MNGERWEHLAQIFERVHTLPPAERLRALERECGDDVGLRDEAVSLLTADESSADFLSQPAFEQLARRFAADGWNLRVGEQIGAYRVIAWLGAGGAGEVWRARDERLARDVAIKVLQRHWRADESRVLRFADEARAAGALNHPNVLTVFDVGEIRGTPYLVSEYLEGRSLRERLADGAFPPELAATLARDVALGLAAAHARGIVHRDLKPENLFLRDDGGVKILDFGLAKLESAPVDGAGDEGAVAQSIVGTAGYMAPEQIQGGQVDARADLFALGVVLHEMLTGRHPFRGASTLETLQAVLARDAPPVGALRDGIPPRLARIVQRLLQKNPAQRFQAAADLAWALEPFARGEDAGDQSPVAPRPRRAVIGALLSAAAVLAFLGAWQWLRPAPRAESPALTQFSWSLPAGLDLASAPAVSPDGRRFAFVAGDGTTNRLYVHDLDTLDAQVVPASAGARQPFWSRDGKILAFFARGHLKKVQWPGGAPLEVADVIDSRGGAWGANGEILFAPDLFEPLRRVHDGGGAVAPAAAIDAATGDNGHLWPAFMPDGVRFLYLVRSLQDGRRGLYAGRVDRPAAAAGGPLLRTDSNGVVAPLAGEDDVALFTTREGRVEVRRIDPRTMRVDERVRTLPIDVGERIVDQPIMLSASTDVLAYVTGILPRGQRLAVYRRTGELERAWKDAGQLNWPRVSPDGRRVALQSVDWLRGNPDLWVEDLERGTRTRVTTAPGPEIQPMWSPDGARLAYVSGALPGRVGERAITISGADGTGPRLAFACPAGKYCEPTDWSADGSTLLLNVSDDAGSDVWLSDLRPARPTPMPLLAETYPERDARLSPDGRWIVYVSEESGRSEVSVRRIRGDGRRIVVSADGGDQPVWRRDGNELFYVDPAGRLRSLPIAWKGGEPSFGIPRELPVPAVGFGHWNTQYDVSPDGSRIFMLRANDAPAPREIRVVVGWRRLLD